MKTTFIQVFAIGLLGALFAASIWFAALYQRDIAYARARVAAGSRVVATPCGRIEYAEAGAGPAILMIHGAGGGFDQGMALAESFAPPGYRVIAMSRFGYLRTPAPDHASIRRQADAHACLLDALGLRSAIVVGVSAGAPSALEFALNRAERCAALVLVVPGWFPSPEAAPRRLGPATQAVFEWALRSDFAFWAFGRLLPAAATRSVLGTPPDLVAAAGAAERERAASMLRNILPVSQRAAGLSLEASLTVEALSKPLDLVKVPTLTISARDDLYGTWQNAQFIARGIPQARFIGFQSGGHLLIGHREEVLAAIARFLRENSPGASRDSAGASPSAMPRRVTPRT